MSELKSLTFYASSTPSRSMCPPPLLMEGKQLVLPFRASQQGCALRVNCSPHGWECVAVYKAASAWHPWCLLSFTSFFTHLLSSLALCIICFLSLFFFFGGSFMCLFVPLGATNARCLRNSVCSSPPSHRFLAVL